MKVIYGNEPYLIEQYKKHFMGMVTMDINLSILSGKYDEEVHGQLHTYPVLDNKRVVILFCDTLKDLDTPLFYDFLDDQPEFSKFLIVVKNMDSRLKIYKKLYSGKLLFECNKFSHQDQFFHAARKELSKCNAEITEDALREFCRRINYFEIDQVNFLEVKSVLYSLASVSKNITSDMVRQYVAENKAVTIFALAEMLKRREMISLKEQISLISPADSILVLSLILKEFRISYKASMYSLRDIGARKILFSDLAPEVQLSCISILNRILIMIKTGQISNENALGHACGLLIQEMEKTGKNITEKEGVK